MSKTSGTRLNDIPWAEPEKNDRVKHINLGDDDDGEHQEQNDVTKNEVGAEHAELRNLAEPLTSRLRN